MRHGDARERRPVTARPRGIAGLALVAGLGAACGSSCLLPAYEATLDTGGGGAGATGGGGTGTMGGGGTGTMGGGGTGTMGGGGTGGCGPDDPAVVWSRTYGDVASQAARAIAIDPGGGVIVVGSMAGTVDLGGDELTSAGADDGFVVKLDSAGIHDWSARFGDVAAQRFSAVAPAMSGGAVIGGDFAGVLGDTSSFAQDAFVATYQDGLSLDVTTGGVSGSTQSVKSVAVDDAGDIFATGDFEGSFNFGVVTDGLGLTDVFVVMLDPTGAHVWSVPIKGAGMQRAAGLAVDKSAPSQVLVAGTFSGNTVLGGGEMIADASMGEDVFLIRVDTMSAALVPDATIIGGSGDQEARGVALDLDGGAVVFGHFTGDIDFAGDTMTSAGGRDLFVARVGADGSPLELYTFGGPGDQLAESVAVDESGNILIAGRFTGQLTFEDQTLTSDSTSEDAFVALLNPSGIPQWSRAFGGSSDQAALAAAFAGANKYVVAGSFSGEIDLGGCPVQGAGADDAFVLQLYP